jgi:hypothetical protein
MKETMVHHAEILPAAAAATVAHQVGQAHLAVPDHLAVQAHLVVPDQAVQVHPVADLQLCHVKK